MLSEAEKWWQNQEIWLQHRVHDMEWVRKGIPELYSFSNLFPSDFAFVLGTGPSIAEIPPAQWAALPSFFTVGVNTFCVQYQKENNLAKLPALNLYIDPKTTQARYEKINGALIKSLGKTLVGYDAWTFHHDWMAPIFGGDPQWDMEFGLYCTPKHRMIFNRCSITAIHLCALLGFKNICLLGIDHGGDYLEGKDLDVAGEGYAIMKNWLSKKNIQLHQCGVHSSIRTLKYIPLKRMLKNATVDIRANSG